VTQVDFYVLQSEDADTRLRTACRVAEKAFAQRQHVLLRAGSVAEAARLDEMLWTFSQNSFVPHRLLTDPLPAAPVERVLIAAGDVPEDLPCEVMINLDAAVPEAFSRYLRVAEIVDGEPTRRNQARERYRFYRDRGYELKTHNI
jgi:DNA polymerase-3 subunit chi